MTARRTNASDPEESTRDLSGESSTWNAFLDKPSAEVLLEAIEFLGGTPNPHSLCRHLTLNVAADARPIGALISVLEPNGALRIAGAFGLDDASLASRATQTAADASPLVEAVRSGQPVFYSSAQLIRERFPEFASRATFVMPTAIWPIMSRGDRIGAIQLFFDESHAESPLTADFEAVVSLIALYVRLQLAAGVSHTRWSTVDRRQQPAGAVVSERRRQSGISELTERQAAVLDHICAGRTNAQIAHVVGYSESTVRQETMAIYRTLGVEGRGQAAALARAHQLELAQAALAESPMI
jgi:DNA-binding CsgD family transcriptional regulator